MPQPPRIIPIPCPFGSHGGDVFVYYVDAPQPALIDTGVAASPLHAIEPALAAAGFRLSDVRWILATHGHWDHIGGAQAARERAADGAQIAIHHEDLGLITNCRGHFGNYMGVQFRYLDAPEEMAKTEAMVLESISGEVAADRELTGGERIDLGGGVVFEAVHTPGHSRGCASYLLQGHNWLFTGDAVQAYGFEKSLFPIIADPVAYRASMRALLEDVRPSRMLLGHRFLNGAGGSFSAQIEGDAVGAAIRGSLDMEARLADAASRLRPDGVDTDASAFADAAEALGYPRDEPRSWPGALFYTLRNYLAARSR